MLISLTGTDASVNQEDIKQLLTECCNQVVSEFRGTEVPLGVTGEKKSNPGKKYGEEKSQEGSTNYNTNSNAIVPPASNRIRDEFDPPSPPENKQFIRKYSRSCFDDVKQFYVTSNKPPTPSQVMYDLLQTGQASNLASEEPFYGDKFDVQSTSNRSA